MTRPQRDILVRTAMGLGAAAALAFVVSLALGDSTTVAVNGLSDKPILFLEPAWFYLIALTPFFFVVRTFSLTDVSVAQQYLATGLRSLLVVGAAIALARPVWTNEDNRIATVVAVDVSASISDAQLEAARRYVAEIDAAKGDDDRVFAVTFAERPRRAGRTDGGAFAIERHPDEGQGSNLQAAVQLSYGLFPPGYLPRLVVVSDGNETGGDLLAEAYRSEELGVRLSWQAFARDAAREIRVAGMVLPDEIKVGAPFEVTAEIWSTHEEEVTVTLHQDDFPNGLEPRKKVALREGINRVKFKTEAKRAGFTTYRLRVADPKEDEEVANNQSVMTAPVRGRPRVLYVEGSVQRNRNSAAYLAKALERENIDVETRGPRGLPSTAKELQRYDLVIISDVPAHFVGMAQMAAVESYVRNIGGGLIMAGGEDSFGSGGYQGTRMEKIMPVRFDSERIREQPNVAIALVVDRSGSMTGPKLLAAKESARATADVLAPSDLITVIGFDNHPSTIVRLQKASNRVRIQNYISKLQAGGGTNIFPALQEAYQSLQGANAKIKHVIVLSDGQAPYDGIADLCQEMRSAGITVSAVGVGNEADRNLLRIIADNGEGRLYMTDDLAALPRIFTKETTEAQRSALVEDLVKVFVAKRVEAIEGVNLDDAPYLKGYVSTKPKPGAETILISDLGEPILARWRVGTGSSVAWTSDVKNRWSVEWVRWNGYPKFWAQLVRTSMRRKVHESYDLYADVVDGRARVVVDAIDNEDRFVNGLETSLEIVDPDTGKSVRTVPMIQSAAGRYEADFAVDRYGSYMLKAVHQRDGRTVAESLGGVALPYPREFLRSTPNERPLRQAASITSGLDQPAPPQLFEAGDESIEHVEDLWPWVLLGIACLLILDLYFKRLRLFGYRAIKF